MGVYVNQKCGSCKKSLTGGYVSNYSGIGEPFIICDRCGTINNNTDRVTEWKLKSSLDKSLFVFQHVFSVVFYYGFGSGVVGTILLSEKVISSMTGLFTIVGCSLALGLFLFFSRLNKAIKASNARMEDARYIAKLRSLGFISSLY